MGFTSRRVVQSRTVMDDLLSARRSGGSLAGGVTVTNRTVRGIPAVQSAVELAADAVAQLGTAVWHGDGPIPEPASPAAWQSRLFRGSPSTVQDAFEFWHTASASLDHRNIAYLWKSKTSKGQVHSLTALHPDQIMPWFSQRLGRIGYQVQFADNFPVPPDVDGYGIVDAGTETLLIIRGRGAMGELIPKTPVELFRTNIGLAIGKPEHEASLLANGAGYGLVVEFPAGTKKPEADQWRDEFDSKHAGPANAGKTKVVGGGAQIKPISMTQSDMQFVESANLSLRDMCLIYHVLPLATLMGLVQPAARPVTPEHEMQRWLRYGLGPRITRIEAAVNFDADLFGPGAVDRFAFTTGGFVRGDLTTEDMIAHQQVQDGRVLVDEWRVEHGRAELPGGIGKIPQITPVGGAPNKNGPVTQPVEPDEDDDASEEV